MAIVMDYVKSVFMADKTEWLRLKEENKLIYSTLLNISRDNTGIILGLGLRINVLFFLFKKLQGYTHKHKAFQVFWGVSSPQYLWSALLCIWLNSCGFRFMLFMAWSVLDFGPWVWTPPTAAQTHINMHKTHTRAENTQSELTQVRWEVKKSIPVKGLNLLTGKTHFR